MVTSINTWLVLLIVFSISMGVVTIALLAIVYSAKKLKSDGMAMGATFGATAFVTVALTVAISSSLSLQANHYISQAQAAYGITLTSANVAALRFDVLGSSSNGLEPSQTVPVGEFLSSAPTSVYVAETDETILVQAKKVAENKISLYEVPPAGEAKQLARR